MMLHVGVWMPSNLVVERYHLVLAWSLLEGHLDSNLTAIPGTTIHLPEAAGPEHIITQFNERFAEYVEEETNGQITVSVVPGGLFGSYEMVQASCR